MAWGESYSGGVGYAGVGHAGCSGSYRGGVGWLMQGWGA